ncbi:ParB/RepB/Spo0J family partition protein [Acetobacter estunensis]|uniref:ParB/RepB/Spo0J family partition protein n=1 Tax=Acetobacter estunensis TaxID=104097 RepID=A0A967B8Y0_9PROT|nr:MULTISPECIES: ParB/RepB/Spo0J family partition protein [Acetobacter]NHN93270.1 ParB/RepB/Spo0J family partition protein [Acetobacter sicerae]NHO55304.1 ParB/RepB/Spo0J family partition protein [Acetobacter estunensis]
MTTKRKTKAPSPILGVAAGLVTDAGNNFIRQGGRFRHTFEVEVASTAPDPDQPRKTFEQESITKLAETMDAEGQLQPILVRRAQDSTAKHPKWTIVAGERRWRAAKLLGWNTLLGIEHDGDPEIASLLENLQRIDLNPQEEATAIDRLITQKGWSQTQAAEALGKSRAEVSAILKILTLPPEILNELASERAVARNALVELARIQDPDRRNELIEQAKSGQLTVKAIRLGKLDGVRDPEQQLGKPRHFTFGSVEKMAHRLSQVRAQHVNLTELDRTRLHMLRAEIDQILEQAKDENP